VTSCRRAAPIDEQDRALVARIAAGSEAAMGALYAAHGRRIYAFALSRLQDPVAASDLVSETLVEVWRGAGRFAGHAPVTTWLLEIARHKLVDELQRRAVRNHEELDASHFDAAAAGDPGNAFVEGPALAGETAGLDPGDWPLRRALRTIERERGAARRVHPVWRVLAVAASLAVLAQAGVLVRQTLGPHAGVRPLGGEASLGDRAVLQIAFAPGASEAAVSALLAEQHATIVDGPSAAGLYRVALRDVAADDEAGAERARAALAGRSDVIARAARE
jgi:RNA polymerase sigma factor (sigma-70 family)